MERRRPALVRRAAGRRPLRAGFSGQSSARFARLICQSNLCVFNAPRIPGITRRPHSRGRPSSSEQEYRERPFDDVWLWGGDPMRKGLVALVALVAVLVPGAAGSAASSTRYLVVLAGAATADG